MWVWPSGGASINQTVTDPGEGNLSVNGNIVSTGTIAATTLSGAVAEANVTGLGGRPRHPHGRRRRVDRPP
jgi:hypothetical protein